MVHAIDSLPWLQGAWARSEALFNTSAPPQGIAVYGPPGIGKHVFAQHLAKVIMCESRASRAEACACTQCRRFDADQQTHLITCAPAQNAASITISQVRDLAAKLHLTVNIHQRRVVIIHPADKLTLAAANALLKNVEEPGEGVHFIFVVDMLSHLPVTLKSRLQCVRLRPPTEQQTLNWLAAHTAPAVTNALVAITGPAPFQALELFESDTFNLWTQAADTLAAYFSAQATLEQVISLLSKLPPEPLLNWLQNYHVQQGSTPNETVAVIWKKLIQAKKAILTSSGVNIQLLLEDLFISWHNLTHAPLKQ